MSVEMSRSEQKRRMKQLEKLVAELSSLPPSLIDQLPCSDEIRSRFQEASVMKGGVKNRHVKYITKMLKNEPVGRFVSKVVNSLIWLLNLLAIWMAYSKA